MGMGLKTNEVVGQGMNTPPSEEEKKKKEQESLQQPQVPQLRSPSSQANVAKAAAPKAAPKQQAAGTGTFSNLKSYLQAAQGGGQQKVAQAATQKVQNVASGAQKGISQATQTFGKQLGAGSGAVFQAGGDQYLTAEQAAKEAKKSTEEIINAARGTVYEAPQPAAVQTEVQPTNPFEDAAKSIRNTDQYFKDFLGDKYTAFQEELNAIQYRKLPMDHGPGSANEAAAIQQGKDQQALYSKYGIDKSKIPTQQTSPTQAPAPTTQAEVTPDQQQRFADIINARYAGPGSLQEAGLYNRAAEKARTAQEAVKQTQTAAGREQLLRNIFSQGRDYSRGQSKLDALLLNASQQGVGQLQQQAQQAGDLQQKLQQAQTESANLATGRTKEISDIQQQARKSFLEGRTAEETKTEQDIDALIKDPALDASGEPIPKLDSAGKPMVDAKGDPIYQTKWDQLPEYYRDVIRNKEATNKAIQAERLAGLETSTGLNKAGYNTALKNVQAQEKALQDARNVNLARSMTGFSLDPEAEARVEAATARLESSKKALAGYSDFANQLKDIKNMNMGQLSLTPEEAAVLGISSGEGLYNIGQDLIQDVNAERGRLITKDQFARQQALARLAGLDTSKALQKDLQYTDAEKAGTQTLSSSLDTEAIRNALNEAQKGFKESAESANLTGVGKKKVSRGNWSGKRTKTYYADQAGNVADMLRQAGYDVSAESPEATKSLLSDKDALANYLNATSTSRSDTGSMYAEGAARTAQGAAAGAAIGTAVGGGVFSAPAAGIGTGIGAIVGSVIGPNSSLSNVVGDLSGGRMSSSAMAKVGKGTAKELAIKDLENKYKAYLAGQGFGNRANVQDTQATSARSAALQDLLRR
jgi:hypothetical protein